MISCCFNECSPSFLKRDARFRRADFPPLYSTIKFLSRVTSFWYSYKFSANFKKILEKNKSIKKTRQNWILKKSIYSDNSANKARFLYFHITRVKKSTTRKIMKLTSIFRKLNSRVLEMIFFKSATFCSSSIKTCDAIFAFCSAETAALCISSSFIISSRFNCFPFTSLKSITDIWL